MSKSLKLGIILAGGTGTRLYPLSNYINKHLLPIYDKPMLDYSISTMILIGIRDILILSDSNTIINFKKRYGDGSTFGVNISYTIQDKPNGIPEIFKIEKDKISNYNKVCLILGDNFFYGSSMSKYFENKFNSYEGAHIFTYKVQNTWDYGILETKINGAPLKIKEKPKKTKSKKAITGIYFFDSTVVEKVKKIKFSNRKELEITDLINLYLKEKKLNYSELPRGFVWYDAGSPIRLIDVSEFVRLIEKRQGLKIMCLEEICYRKKLINKKEFKKLINDIPNSEYKSYLINIKDENTQN